MSPAGASDPNGEEASTSRTAVSANERQGARQALTRSPRPGTECDPLIISASTVTLPESRSASKTVRAASMSSPSVPVRSSSSR